MKQLIALIGLVVGSAQAAPVSINFEDVTESDIVINSHGYQFASDLSSQILIGAPDSSAAYCPGCSVTMTNEANQPFILFAVDFGNPQFPVAGDANITVTGNYYGGGQISTTLLVPAVSTGFALATYNFGAAWSGLQSVVFGPADTGSAMVMDNIVVDAVPVPAAVWLFASAMAGLFGCRRRLL